MNPGFTQPAPIYKSLLPSPLSIITMGERAKQADEERKLKQLQQTQAENAKTLDRAFTYSPNPVLSQYQGYFDDVKNKVYDQARPLYYKKDPLAREGVNRMISDSESDLNVVKDMEQQMGTVRELAKQQNNRYNSEWVNNNLFHTLYHPDGSLKSPRELNPQDPHNLLQDHRAYNIAGLNQDFAKGVDEDVSNEFKMVSKGGMKFQDKIKKVSKFAKLDGNGDAVYDDNGRLQLNITPELVSRYLNDDGRRLWAEQLVKEKQTAFDALKGVGKINRQASFNYSLKDAVGELLASQGYAKQSLDNRQVLDKNTFDNNIFIGGGKEADARHRSAAKYFYDLIHGDEGTKKSLMGDISMGKDFSASFQKTPQAGAGSPPIEPSKSGYVVVDYDPLSKMGSFMDAMLEQAAVQSGAISQEEIKDYKEAARKDHKIYINLDDEKGAMRELNYWRNLARNADINSDFLDEAYDQYSSKQKPSPKLVIPSGSSGGGGKAPKLKI